MSYLRGVWVLGMLLAGGCAALAGLDNSYVIDDGEGGAPTGGLGGSTATATTGSTTLGVGGGGGGGGEGIGGGGLPTSSFLFRRPISIITGNAAAPSGYSIQVQVDHSSLVLNKKSLPSGDDIRVYHKNGDAFEELHRTLDPTSAWNTGATTLWFRLKADIPASTTDTSYYLFYGDQDAPSPPADGTQVYLVWDDFTSPSVDPAWTFLPIGSAEGTVKQTGGVVEITASTGDIYWDQDGFVFLHRPVTGDFVADAVVTKVGGSSSKWGKPGGVMIRESTQANSRNRIMAPMYSDKARTNSYRLEDGDDTVEQTVNGSLTLPEFGRVTRMGDRSNAYFSNDGQMFQKLGNEITFLTPLSPTILVGIPVANLSLSEVTVSVDWFRVRKLINPEPTTSLLPEETGEF